MAKLGGSAVEHRSGLQQELGRVDRRIREIVAAIAEAFRSEALCAVDAREPKDRARVAGRAATGRHTPPANLAHVFRAAVTMLVDRLSTSTSRDHVYRKLRATSADIAELPIDTGDELVGEQMMRPSAANELVEFDRTGRRDRRRPIVIGVRARGAGDEAISCARSVLDA